MIETIGTRNRSGSYHECPAWAGAHTGLHCGACQMEANWSRHERNRALDRLSLAYRPALPHTAPVYGPVRAYDWVQESRERGWTLD